MARLVDAPDGTRLSAAIVTCDSAAAIAAAPLGLVAQLAAAGGSRAFAPRTSQLEARPQ
jgi:hypothetical protein